MKINQLKSTLTSNKKRKRVGRGSGSGFGKTAGRGVSGQKSRSGVAINGFEGGQMPLYRRLPKHGFNNIFRKNYSIVNIGTIQDFIDSSKLTIKSNVNAQLLLESGVVSKLKDGIKLLGNGSLKSKINIEVSAASKRAIKIIEKQGGSVAIIKKENKDDNKNIDVSK